MPGPSHNRKSIKTEQPAVVRRAILLKSVSGGLDDDSTTSSYPSSGSHVKRGFLLALALARRMGVPSLPH